MTPKFIRRTLALDVLFEYGVLCHTLILFLDSVLGHLTTEPTIPLSQNVRIISLLSGTRLK